MNVTPHSPCFLCTWSTAAQRGAQAGGQAAESWGADGARDHDAHVTSALAGPAASDRERPRVVPRAQPRRTVMRLLQRLCVQRVQHVVDAVAELQAQGGDGAHGSSGWADVAPEGRKEGRVCCWGGGCCARQAPHTRQRAQQKAPLTRSSAAMPSSTAFQGKVCGPWVFECQG